MPKIIHIVLGKANPERLNGVNKVVSSLALSATEAHRSVEVWGLSADENPSASVLFPLKLFTVKSRFLLPRSLRAAIQHEAADTIFHLHGGFIPLYRILAFYLKRQNKRYVITLHGNLLKRSIRRGFWYKYPYLVLCERFLLKHAACIHAITLQEQTELQPWCGNAPIVLIPNGASLSPPSIPLHRHPAIRFLYMGRFDCEHKGLDILIKAFRVFYEATRDGYLFLAGDGPDKDRLQHTIKKFHLEHRVKILAPHFQNAKTQLLNDADVFVHTSRWDVMPTGCLEAAAQGKPLIVTYQTGLAPFLKTYQAGWSTSLLVSEVAQAFSTAFNAWKTGRLPPIGAQAQNMIQTDLQWPHLLKRFYTDIYDVVA